jgi:hypothetical protein
VVPAREEAFFLALNPEPEGLRARGIDEDEDVFDALEGEPFPQRLLGSGIRERRGFVLGGDFNHGEAGKLRDLTRGPVGALVFDQQGLARSGLVPAELLDKEVGELETLELLAGAVGMEMGDGQES